MGGIADRWHYAMTRNHDVLTGTGTLLSTKSNGDLIFWCKSGSTYLREGASGCPVSDPHPSPDPLLTVAPATWVITDGLSGAGEFFYGDWFVGNPAATLGQAKHNEIMLGGRSNLPVHNKWYPPL